MERRLHLISSEVARHRCSVLAIVLVLFFGAGKIKVLQLMVCMGIDTPRRCESNFKEIDCLFKYLYMSVLII